MNDMRTIAFLVIAFGFAIVASCNKIDEQSPTIIVSAPLEGALFNVFDTVHVAFTVKDETQLVSASVKIVNEDQIPVTNSYTVSLNETNFSGTAQVIIEDKHLLSGNYHVVVSASDGTNDQRAFRKIRIIEMPKVRRAIFFSERTTTGVSRIYKVDSLFQTVAMFIEPNQDIKKVCVNSLQDQLTIVGNYSTGIQSFSTVNKSQQWSDATFSVPQTPRYMDLICYKNDIYTSIYDREIRSYNSTGALTMNSPTGVYRPGILYADDNYLVVEQQPVGDQTHFLFVYQAATQALLRQQQLPIDIMAICALQGNTVLVFGNDGQQARVYEYDMSDNSYWEPRQMPEGKILDALKMDGNMYAIAHENGLYSYTYSPNYLNNIRPGIACQDICFDADNNRIIAAVGNTLEELSIGGQVLNSVTHTDSIGSIDVHYTK